MTSSRPVTSQAIVPYKPCQTTDELLETQIIGNICKVFQRAMELEKSNLESHSSSIPKSSISIKLRGILNEVLSIHKEGLLDGEFLLAKGSEIMMHLRSNEVTDIATSTSQDPQFMIGSVSKQFFAVALLKALYDYKAEGNSEFEKTKDVERLLNRPVCELFPGYEAFWNGKIPDSANQITLHHLLSHTSGLKNYTDCEEYYEKNETGKCFNETFHSVNDIMKLVSKYDLNFVPGSEFSYSNTGYRLIYEVISGITKMPASQYLQKEILAPIEMKSSTSPEKGNDIQLREEDPNCSRLVKQWGYDPTKNPLDLQPVLSMEDLSCTQGDGSIISTVSDLLKWNRALHKEKSVLSKPLYKLFTRPNLDGYAYGINQLEFSDGTMLNHGGAIGKYRSNLFYLPAQDISIIQFSNVHFQSPDIEKEAESLSKSLEDRYPDKKERQEKVHEILIKKYPDKRAFIRKDDLFQPFYE